MAGNAFDGTGSFTGESAVQRESTRWPGMPEEVHDRQPVGPRHSCGSRAGAGPGRDYRPAARRRHRSQGGCRFTPEEAAARILDAIGRDAVVAASQADEDMRQLTAEFRAVQTALGSTRSLLAEVLREIAAEATISGYVLRNWIEAARSLGAGDL